MIDGRTHYVGDDCPGAHRPRSLQAVGTGVLVGRPSWSSSFVYSLLAAALGYGAQRA